MKLNIAIAAAAATLPTAFGSKVVDLGNKRPEGITRGPKEDTYYVSELFFGGIKEVDLSGDAPVITQVVESFGFVERLAIGLEYDEERDLIIACGGGPPLGASETGVYAYLRDGSEVAVCRPDESYGFINDVAIRDGKGYFTDSLSNQLYVLDLDELADGNCVAETVVLPDVFIPTGGFTANGIVSYANGLVIVLIPGGIYYVDLDTLEETELVSPDATGGGGDGLSLVDDLLYVSFNAQNKHGVYELSFDGMMVSATFVGDISSDAYDAPATNAVWGDTLASVNARFGTLPPPAEGEPDPSTFTESFELVAVNSFEFDEPCVNIVDVACGTEGFSILCTAVQAAGLVDALGGDDLTVFAPTDEAFLELGAILDAALDDIVFLTDILLFHVVAGKVASTDLVCTDTVEMLNGQDSRTVCLGHAGSDGIFQKGGSNSRDNSPQIVAFDIETCQGFIHVVDGVLLPGRLVTSEHGPDVDPEEPECQSIAEIACGLDDFSILCSAVVAAGLDGALDGDDKLTVFAPTNAAFEELGDVLDDVVADVDLLTNILLYHVTAGEVFADDLVCTGLVPMLQGQNSRTVCLGHDGANGIFQKGGSNPRSNMPQIVATDIEACNGVIHVVDGVLLPGVHN